MAELTDFNVSPLLLLMLMLRSSEPRAKRFCQKNIEKDQTHTHTLTYLWAPGSSGNSLRMLPQNRNLSKRQIQTYHSSYYYCSIYLRDLWLYRRRLPLAVPTASWLDVSDQTHTVRCSLQNTHTHTHTHTLIEILQVYYYFIPESSLTTSELCVLHKNSVPITHQKKQNHTLCTNFR